MKTADRHLQVLSLYFYLVYLTVIIDASNKFVYWDFTGISAEYHGKWKIKKNMFCSIIKKD
jgi:hypothetical protein